MVFWGDIEAQLIEFGHPDFLHAITPEMPLGPVSFPLPPARDFFWVLVMAEFSTKQSSSGRREPGSDAALLNQMLQAANRQRPESCL